MKIIKSKYSFDSLGQLYEKEGDKVDDKYVERIHALPSLVGAFCFVLYLCGLAALLFFTKVNAFAASIALLSPLFCVPFSIFCLDNYTSFLINHYKKKGIVLYNPLEEISPYIQFVQVGETLYNLLERYPEAEIHFDGNNKFIIYMKNYKTGCLEELETCEILNLSSDDITSLFNTPDTLDFSIFDDKLEKAVNKSNKAKEEK